LALRSEKPSGGCGWRPHQFLLCMPYPINTSDERPLMLIMKKSRQALVRGGRRPSGAYGRKGRRACLHGEIDAVASDNDS
jgi:hypothetical protein